jgi:hypothetical protein
VKTIQELFALLQCLETPLLRFDALLILAMHLPKRGWQGSLLMKSVFDGLKNLLLKGNAMVFAPLDIATEMELDARKMWKEQKRTFWLPLMLAMCMRWFVWALCLTETILNDFFGLEELPQKCVLCLSWAK